MITIGLPLGVSAAGKERSVRIQQEGDLNHVDWILTIIDSCQKIKIKKKIAAYAYYGDKLGGSSAAPEAKAAAAIPKEPIASALDPNAFVDFKLKSVHPLTPNTSRFTFELKEGQTLGMEVTSCVVTKFVKEDGKPVIRPYTPTSDVDQTGSFDFVIKHYEGTIYGITRLERILAVHIN